MPASTVHLVCNAHLDPVWLWEWEEGAAEALSTFRETARLCRDFKAFVFNHNESLLYRWVEEFEPELFEEIRELVRLGRWHIMGGWLVQPDANMPSGESFVRQVQTGKSYFREKFGVEPSTGINLDSFGHSRGLVQILAKSGYDAYVFCRPGQGDMALPGDEFVWVGYDGSEIMAARAAAHYNSRRGQARQKVEEGLRAAAEKPASLLLWGIGDHGGGPSRLDLEEIEKLRASPGGERLLHSTPEAYFKELAGHREALPRVSQGLNPWAPGCYTSMARVKLRHRLLENEIFAAEKMASAAHFQGLLRYPREEIREALRALLFGEFHDILPGSSIPPAEEAALRLFDHGLVTISRVKARAFLALSAGQRPAATDDIPILVYNPHPFPVATVIECEFQPAEPNYKGGFLLPSVRDSLGRALVSQPEKEHCTLSLEWRKRVVFRAELAPYAMNRFDCRLERSAGKPAPPAAARQGRLVLGSGELEVLVNTRTGLLDGLRHQGVRFLGAKAFQPLVIQDNADPWGMTVRSFRTPAGSFRLMSPSRGTAFSGVEGAPLDSVRIIEDGPVRTVVEAVFAYRDSFLVHRYKMPRSGVELEVETRVLWNEKDKMLKLRLPTPFRNGLCLGQTAYGAEELFANGDETVSQKWLAVVDRGKRLALTVVKDRIYGADFADGELRLSLLRSPAYSADPAVGRPLACRDRFLPRQDQGEHIFRFWLKPGEAASRLEAVDREALVHHERPFALSLFPAGKGRDGGTFLELKDGVIQMTAVKQSEEDDDLVIRLFNPTPEERRTVLKLPFLGTDDQLEMELAFRPFEIKTCRVKPGTGRFWETDLLERPRAK